MFFEHFRADTVGRRCVAMLPGSPFRRGAADSRRTYMPDSSPPALHQETPECRAAADRAASLVDRDRLWDRHMGMAIHGAFGETGVNRQAFSAEDAAGRRRMEIWTKRLGLQTHLDKLTNLFFRRDGAEPDLAPVLVGSHLDSQPTGGRFDGASGVLCGLEALEAIHAAGLTLARPVELVAWVNEEGSRYTPGMTGSAFFAGQDPEELLQLRDTEGIALADELPQMRAATPDAVHRWETVVPHAYLELHIEQGPQLEQAGLPVGVVTGIQGARWFTVTVSGEAAHAGTTPMTQRRDALSAAVRMVAKLEDAMAKAGDEDVRFTIGRFQVGPGAPNTVPDMVRFTIDFRHPSREVLTRLGDVIEPICWEQARPCGVTVEETQRGDPVAFPSHLVDVVETSVETLGLPSMRLSSGANHDAKFVARVCPSAMIFVPCRGGVSHNPEEYASPEDLAAGTRALTHALVRLAGVV